MLVVVNNELNRNKNEIDITLRYYGLGANYKSFNKK